MSNLEDYQKRGEREATGKKFDLQNLTRKHEEQVVLRIMGHRRSRKGKLSNQKDRDTKTATNSQPSAESKVCQRRQSMSTHDVNRQYAAPKHVTQFRIRTRASSYVPRLGERLHSKDIQMRHRACIYPLDKYSVIHVSCQAPEILKVSEAFAPKEFRVWWEKKEARLLSSHCVPDTVLDTSAEA